MFGVGHCTWCICEKKKFKRNRQRIPAHRRKYESMKRKKKQSIVNVLSVCHIVLVLNDYFPSASLSDSHIHWNNDITTREKNRNQSLEFISFEARVRSRPRFYFPLKFSLIGFNYFTQINSIESKNPYRATTSKSNQTAWTHFRIPKSMCSCALV